MCGIRSMLFAGLIAVLAGAWTVSAAEAARAARPREAVPNEGCVRADCHPNIKADAVVHGPVAVNACDACHTAASVEKHTFTAARAGAELCTYCHEFDVSRMPVVHKPVTTGECVGCHSPHGGTSHALLREATVRDTCARCHEDTLAGRAFKHTPAKDGACDSCHPPHASRFPKLLDVVGTDLCLTCHAEMGERLAALPVTHKAIGEHGCRKCHDPHGAEHPMATTQPVVDQCGGCHAATLATAAGAKHRHACVTDGRACVTCHTPHAGAVAKLLSDVPAKDCMGCHKDPQKAADGKAIAAVTEATAAGAHTHGPLKDGQCAAGCHTPHGGDVPRMLAKPYAAGYYQRFAAEKYALCFSCHDLDLAMAERTATHTAFRDGDRNLHYVHVHEKKYGESCRVCHETHASVGNDRLLRGWVKYGVWKMPLNFAKAPTGGWCAPGCHVPYAYDRDRPKGATAPTSRPAQLPIVRGGDLPAEAVRWTASAADGAAVRVPADGGRPAMVVFARDSGAVELKALAAAMPSRSKADVVVVVTGGSAVPGAYPFKVVSDPGGALAAQSGVKAWPTALLVRGDGTVAARVGGPAGTFAMRLTAYVDADAPTTAPATRLVADPARSAGRAVATARALLDQGRARQALAILDDALRREPDSAAARIERAVALVRLDRAADAMKALDGLPDAAAAGGRARVARAEALAAQERWTEALRAAEGAVATEAGSADLHEVLGRIHSQQGNWETAAREYRMAVDIRKRKPVTQPVK